MVSSIWIWMGICCRRPSMHRKFVRRSDVWRLSQGKQYCVAVLSFHTLDEILPLEFTAQTFQKCQLINDATVIVASRLLINYKWPSVGARVFLFNFNLMLTTFGGECVRQRVLHWIECWTQFNSAFSLVHDSNGDCGRMHQFQIKTLQRHFLMRINESSKQKQ